ncbi:uncharacterized protein LOC144799156 [Lissotriton helveticus]
MTGLISSRHDTLLRGVSTCVGVSEETSVCGTEEIRRKQNIVNRRLESNTRKAGRQAVHFMTLDISISARLEVIPLTKMQMHRNALGINASTDEIDVLFSY